MTKNSKTAIVLPNKTRRLLVTRDSSIHFPELYMNVMVVGPPGDQIGFPEMFARARCYKAEHIDEADLVVFTGGPDVDPALYGSEPCPETLIDPARDKADLDIYAECYEKGIPMMGVCRGAQFGHVMNGGQLYQDVDNHNTGHAMFVPASNKTIFVSSVHHQMCIQNEWMDVIGVSHTSTRRLIEPDVTSVGTQADVEAFFYDDTCFFGVQGHPEYAPGGAFARWCIEQILDLIAHNPNIRPVNRTYRLDPAFIAQREAMKTEKKKEA